MDIIGRLTDVEQATTRAGKAQVKLTIQEGNRKLIATTDVGNQYGSDTLALSLIRGNSYKFSLGGEGKLFNGVAYYFFNGAEPTTAIDPPEPEGVLAPTGTTVLDSRDRAIAMESAYSTAAKFFARRMTFVDAEGSEWPYGTDHLHTLAMEIYTAIESARAVVQP